MEVYKYRRNIIHTIIWLSFFSIVYLGFSVRLSTSEVIILSSCIVGIQVFSFYLNYNLFIPKIYLKRKYILYFLLTLGLLVIAVLIGRIVSDEFLLNNRPNFPPPFKDFRGGRPFNPQKFAFLRSIPLLVITIASLLISSLLRITEHAREKENEMEVLRAETYNAELKFLRSQINPHFLFNALNNIYSLAVTESSNTPDMLLKLSNILRYLIYECNVEKVPLLKEIEYINNYIDLQKLKDEEIKNITFDYQVTHAEIAPMILITFIENAFKHSRIEDIQSSWIKIYINANGDGILKFTASNSIPGSNFEKDETGGVGLENVKKRLSLLYPQKHELNFHQDKDKFEVELNIDLN